MHAGLSNTLRLVQNVKGNDKSVTTQVFFNGVALQLKSYFCIIIDATLSCARLIRPHALTCYVKKPKEDSDVLLSARKCVDCRFSLSLDISH